MHVLVYENVVLHSRRRVFLSQLDDQKSVRHGIELGHAKMPVRGSEDL